MKAFQKTFMKNKTFQKEIQILSIEGSSQVIVKVPSEDVKSAAAEYSFTNMDDALQFATGIRRENQKAPLTKAKTIQRAWKKIPGATPLE